MRLDSLVVQVSEGGSSTKPSVQLMVLSAAGQCLWQTALSQLQESSWMTYVRTPQKSRFATSPCGKHIALLDPQQVLRILDAATGTHTLMQSCHLGPLMSKAKGSDCIGP